MAFLKAREKNEGSEYPTASDTASMVACELRRREAAFSTRRFWRNWFGDIEVALRKTLRNCGGLKRAMAA
jgi:hypothetical protein